MGGVQHTVHTVVGERIGVAGAVRGPVHAADVTIVMAAITQDLRECRYGFRQGVFSQSSIAILPLVFFRCTAMDD
jgi:purine-nucleoside phosphorylase